MTCGEMRSVQIKDTGVREHLNVVWYYILARLLLGFAVLVWVLLSVRLTAISPSGQFVVLYTGWCIRSNGYDGVLFYLTR